MQLDISTNTTAHRGNRTTTAEPLTVRDIATAPDQLLIQTALKLSRLHREKNGLPVHLRRHLANLNNELEHRYPQVTPVMDRWAYSKAPMASYTETLVGALPPSARGL